MMTADQFLARDIRIGSIAALCFVILADEELMIARHTADKLDAG
jgi:hypothetical protein